MTTYLNVLFRDKADAKPRWRSEARKFVPMGRARAVNQPAACRSGKAASHDLTAPSEGVPLSQLRTGVANTLRRSANVAAAGFRKVVAQMPEKTLGRRFAVVQSANGQIITNAEAATQATHIRLTFQDATIKASVQPGKEIT